MADPTTVYDRLSLPRIQKKQSTHELNPFALRQESIDIQVIRTAARKQAGICHSELTNQVLSSSFGDFAIWSFEID
jgi:hypothetical protein